jgi:hypothetical protein
MYAPVVAPVVASCSWDDNSCILIKVLARTPPSMCSVEQWGIFQLIFGSGVMGRRCFAWGPEPGAKKQHLFRRVGSHFDYLEQLPFVAS